jgi:LPS-assembly lipoprotein
LVIGIFLASCGFHPIYGNSNNTAINSQLGAIHIATIEDRVGHKLHNQLLDRINPRGRALNPLYTLTIKAQVIRSEIGLRINEETTRARLSLSVKFFLSERNSGNVILEGSVRSVNSYNIPASEFALIAAEDNATDRATREISDEIRTRLGLFFAKRID